MSRVTARSFRPHQPSPAVESVARVARVARTFIATLAVFAISATPPAPARAQSLVWTQRVVSSPSPRSGNVMAYDSARGVTVLFGGFTASGRSGETWEWNGTAWTQRTVSGPSPRYQSAMVYDSNRGVSVLFGGNIGTDSNEIPIGETWEWNGTNWTHRLVSEPSPRFDLAMAYDAARGVTVLFDGFTASGRVDETWEWNGTSWAHRAASGPAPRNSHAMAYDAARGVTVLFGGYCCYGDTWVWNGTVWTQRATNGPSERSGHAMSFDAARGMTVLFGGDSNGHNAETWEWNGTVWTQRMILGPSPRSWDAMAWDAARGETVLFGGDQNGETWVLGATPSITQQPVGHTVRVADAASFSAGASGFGLSYQWRRNGVNLTNGGAISGAASTTLTINPVVLTDDASAFDCVVSNTYGSARTDPAVLSVTPRCTADFNHSGAIDSQDFFDFLAAFFAGC